MYIYPYCWTLKIRQTTPTNKCAKERKKNIQEKWAKTPFTSSAGSTGEKITPYFVARLRSSSRGEKVVKPPQFSWKFSLCPTIKKSNSLLVSWSEIFSSRAHLKKKDNRKGKNKHKGP
ncbi:hypothetical protein QE152_g17007 [Popillia japonica]|uniref:Uncharacterized protein n=1 Tax=Popillia japonica TaxID=7064 RepID=A0AAW1L4G6_POPJA